MKANDFLDDKKPTASSFLDSDQPTGFKTKSLAELLSTYGQPDTLNEGAKVVSGLPGVIEVGARRGYAGIGKVEQGALSILGDLLNSEALRNASDVVGNRARQIENSAVLQGKRSTGFAPDSIVNDLPEAGANAVSSVIQTAPSLLAGAIAPGAALPALFGQTFSQEYAQGKDAGLTPLKATGRAVPMAAFEVAGEKLGGFDRLAEGLRKATAGNGVADLGSAMLSSALREIPSEEFTTTGQFLTDKAPVIGINQDATLADYGQQVKDTALATALQSGAMGAGGRVLQRIAAPGQSVMSGMDQTQEVQAQPATQQINPDAIMSAINQATSNVKPSAADFLDADTTEAANVSQPAQQSVAGVDSGATGLPPDNRTGSPAVESIAPNANAGSDSAVPNGAMPASDIPDGAAPGEPVAGVGQQSSNPLQLPIEFESEAKNSPAYNDVSLPDDVKSMADQFNAEEVNKLLSEAGYVEPRQPESKGASSASQIENTQPQSAASSIAGDPRRETGQTARVETAAQNEVAGTPGSNEREGTRQQVESIVKRRAAANQLGKLKPFDNALKLAKDFMNGENVAPTKFKNAAILFANDKPLADAFTALQELAKSPAKESRQSARSAVDIFTDEINNAQTVDQLKSIARNIQMETGVLNDAMAQQLDDLVMARIDALSQAETDEAPEPGSETPGQSSEKNQYKVFVRNGRKESSFIIVKRGTGEAQSSEIDNTENNIKALNQRNLKPEFEAIGITEYLARQNNVDAESPAATDLLGDNTENQQAIADAERAKDAKRNTGADNASDFVLTGSDRSADQAAARGAQDMFDSEDNPSFKRSDDDELSVAAKKYFGTTLNKNEAGYILPDGTMLDLSGKHIASKDNWKYMRGERATDHREFFAENIHNGAKLDGLIKAKDGNDAMLEFMARTGAMRVDFQAGVASIAVPPSSKQINALGNGMRGEYLALEYFDAKTGRIIDDIEIESSSPSKVKQFFDAAITKTASKDAPMFKRDAITDAIAGIGRQQAQAVDRVQSQIETITKGWKNAPTIQVVYDMTDESIPEAVRKENDRQLSQGATGQPQGFITRGNVFIVASEMSGEKDVLRTLFHESLGHYGLRGLYNEPALNAALDRVATMRATDVAKKAKQYGLDIRNERDRLIAAEEVLAELAETRPEIGVVKQVIATIRAWLRENVPYFKNLELSDAEIIRDYILPARRYVEAGGKEQTAGNVVAAFQRSKEAEPKRSMMRDELGRWKAPTSDLIAMADSKIKVPLTDKRFSEISKTVIDAIAFGQAPKELRTMTRLYKADIQKAMDAASNVVKTMAPMSQLDRALVSDVVEKMVAAGVTPPESIVKIATGMQNAMDIQTDELVSLGMLSQDSADRWRGKYLPRFYMRENNEGVKAWVGKMLRNSLPVRGIGGNSLKGRGLFEEVNVNEVPKYEALGWEVRDPLWKKNRQGELELMDANKVVTPEKVVVWRDWTPSERAEMGENRDALFRFVMGYTSMQNDIALGRLFDSIAKNQEWTRARASEGYVKVPDSEIPETGGVKRYGNLAGLYVKNEILDHISQYEEASELWKYYRKALSFWKAGKALALDTPIPTLSGWSTMGEIKTGDTVFDEHGKPCKVTFATGVQLERECYEVEFSDGTKIIADAEHLWFTIYHGKGSVKNTKLIMDTLKERTRGDNNHSIPVAGALQTPDADLPIPPYALGAWLGDGHSYSAAICAGAKDADETAANVRAAGLAVGAYSIDKRNGVVTFGIRYTDSSLKRCDGLQPVMRRMNLLRNKHIPAIYLRASEAQRRDLLCGLMDTDGYITENGKCEFSTTSPQVRDGMMELLRSLGYKPVCGSYTARLNGRNCGDSWRIMFQAYGDRPVFKMARKLDRMRDCPKTRQRSGTRQIVAIRPVPSVPVKCIQVDSESRLYLAGDGMVPTHNTVLNPVAHVNNVVSNLTMAHFAGVSYWDAHKYVLAIKDLANNAPMVQEAKDRGLMTGDITRAELMSDMPDDIKEMMQMQESAIKRKASTVFNIITFGLSKPMGKAYRFEDDFFKYLIYRDARKNGLSPDDAVDYATRYIFTYDDLPKGARTVRDLAIPFFAYTYKAVPALTHTLFNYPWRFAAPAAAVWGVNAIAYALAAGDDGDDWQTMYEKGKELEAEERDNLPPWMRGRSALGAQKSIRLGTDDKTQLPVYMDVSRMIPGGDIFDVTNQADGVPVPAPIMPSNPVLTMIAAMFWNKDTFTGKEVTDLNDTGKEAAQKRAEWLLKQLSPAVAPTAYHFDRLAEATALMSDKTIETPWKDYTGYGKDGLPVQGKYAVPQTFGIKARPIDLERSAEISQGQDNKEIRSIMAEIRQAARLLDQNAISQREYDRRVSDAEEKINAIENK